MGQETTSDKQIPGGKVYKDTAVSVGTFLGGPMAAGYLVGENYKTFGERGKRWAAFAIGIAATVLLFSLLFFVPYLDKIPNMVFPVVYTWITYFIVRLLQGEEINAHIRKGGAAHGWLRVIIVSILAAALTLAGVVGVAFLAGDFSDKSTATNSDNFTTKTYGTIKHEILFEKDNISEIEVNKIAAALTKTGFFDSEKQKSTDAKKVGSSYEINLYCNDTIKTDPETVGYFIELRNEMQKLFPDSQIVFNLVIGTPDNVIKRLE